MALGGVKFERRGRIIVLTLDVAPSNALTPDLRADLLAELRTLSDCDAVVLTGAGPNFSSALPLEADTARPTLGELCQAIAEAPIPVIAALQGLVLGPGAELAMAAHARIGSRDTRIAFPEIALGLCPGGGTSLRLPARIGAGAALRLLLTGCAVAADEGLELGLLDRLADGPPLDLAIAHAGSMSKAAPPTAEPAPRQLAAIAAARRADPGARAAARGVIACIEAACLFPPDAALAFEAVTREDLEAGADAVGLRAAARAERRLARLPLAVAEAEALPMQELALVGADPALTKLAEVAVKAGVPVIWLYDQGVVPPGQGLPVRLTDDPLALDGAVMQVHAATPTGQRRPLPPGTARLVLGGAEGEMGLSLTPRSKVCELSVLPEDPPRSVATAIAGLRRIGLAPVLVGPRPVVGQRVAKAGRAALQRLAALGVPTDQLQAALQAFSAVEAASHCNDDWPPDTILRRWLAAQANEGLRLLHAGFARRPSDIDYLLVSGYGFPRWRGGPMHQADQRGLLVLRHDLRDWAAEDAFWTPAPLLDRLISDGLRLGDLDERV